MRKVKRGVRSLAEVSTLPLTEAPKGDPGLRYNGLARYRREEAEREKQANLVKLDALLQNVNDPVLAQHCAVWLGGDVDAETFTNEIANAWDRFAARRLQGIPKAAQDQIMLMFRKIVFRNRELAWIGDNADNTFDRTFDYMLSLGLADRLGLTKPAPQKQTEFEKLLATVSGDSREGRAAFKDAGNREYMQQASWMFDQWESQLFRDYQVRLTEDQKRLVLNYFVDHNLSWLTHENYNAARRYLVDLRPPRGLSYACLTPDEREVRRLESTPDACSDDYAARLAYKQHRTQLLNEIKTPVPSEV